MGRAPHDHLFKAVFSRPADASSFLKAYLPPALAAAIRWDTLQCVKSSFQESDGRRSEADLVFSARMETRDARADGVDLEIAILFEHQSTADDQMPLRLLGYLVRAFEAQVAERERRRPVPVIPVVLYHGERAWTTPTSFGDWLDLPPSARLMLSDFIPDFRHVLETRRAPRPEAYAGSATVQLTRLLFDHLGSARFFDLLMGWGEVIRELEASMGEQGVVPVLALAVSYVYDVVQDAAEPLAQAFEALGAHGLKDIAMNTFEQAIAKGRSEGLELGRSEGLELGRSEGLELGRSEGLELGAREMLLRGCERRFGPLPEAVRARVEGADRATIDGWFDNLLVARSLEQVFDTLPA